MQEPVKVPDPVARSEDVEMKTEERPNDEKEKEAADTAVVEGGSQEVADEADDTPKKGKAGRGGRGRGRGRAKGRGRGRAKKVEISLSRGLSTLDLREQMIDVCLG